jgi:UDPglucose 6-dehydrogenase
MRRRSAFSRTGGIPIFEPGLQAMVKANVDAGRLRFTTDVEEAVAHGLLQFIAVGTPADEDGSADLQYVVAAARNVGRFMTGYKVVVDKSTVPVGTADKVQAALPRNWRADLSIDYSVVSNPEFLKEGAALADFMKPDRIVVGTQDAARDRSDARTLCAFPAQSRALAGDGCAQRRTDQVRRQCDAGDAHQLHERTGQPQLNGWGRISNWCARALVPTRESVSTFLYPGRRLRRLVLSERRAGADSHGARCRVTSSRCCSAVEEANDAQKSVLTQKIVKRLGEDLSGKTIALWGLAFKPNTDDMREAPSRVLIADLLARGARDPRLRPGGGHEAQRIFAGETRIDLCRQADGGRAGADVLAIVTEWKEFRAPDFPAIKALLKTPVIFDGRNLYDPAVPRRAGLEYFAIGRL